MPEGDEWRKLLAGPLGVAFWFVVLALRARRKKPASADASDAQKARNRGYFFGRQVRLLWDLCVQGGRSPQRATASLAKITNERQRLTYGSASATKPGNPAE